MPVYKKPYLQPYKGKSTRHICPACKTKQSFTLYIDGNTLQPIHPTVGKCNREIKCGYHYTPRQFFNDHPDRPANKQLPQPKSPQHQPTQSPQNRAVPATPVIMDTIPYKYVKQSASYNSHFVRFLCNYFPKEKIENVAEDYALGATKKKEVIFWQIDIQGKTRTGKIMQYNPETGKRIKNKPGAINWVHNKLKYNNPHYANFNLCQCYFGEHLLRLYPDKPVAIVEAEKTAVITSMVIPQYNWLAAGNLNGLNIEKSKILENRDIVLYPDAGCYDKWYKKMQQIRSEIYCRITISRLIEIHATLKQKEAGYDLADYIIQQLKAENNLPQPRSAHKTQPRTQTPPRAKQQTHLQPQPMLQTPPKPQLNPHANQTSRYRNNPQTPQQQLDSRQDPQSGSQPPLKVKQHSQPQPNLQPQPAPSIPFSPTLQRMINLNPSLLTLINEFQLVEIY